MKRGSRKLLQKLARGMKWDFLSKTLILHITITILLQNRIMLMVFFIFQYIIHKEIAANRVIKMH